MTNEELAALLTKLGTSPGLKSQQWMKRDAALIAAGCAVEAHHAQIVAGLAALGEVERMRAEIQGGALVPISEWNITIAERDALKVVLQPFADACTKADASSEGVRRAGMGHGHSDDATPGWGIRYKHLKAARAALRSVRPEDITSSMIDALCDAWPDDTEFPGDDEDVRRAIAAAIAKGAE